LDTIAASIFLALLAVQPIGTVVYLCLIRQLFVRIEERHTDTWRALGEPSLFLNNTIRNNFRVLGWLWRKDYSSLGIPDDVRLAARVRQLYVLLMIMFGILLVSFLAFGFSIHGR
jgi:hypothetical protein